jgi:hypothetical protein
MDPDQRRIWPGGGRDKFARIVCQSLLECHQGLAGRFRPAAFLGGDHRVESGSYIRNNRFIVDDRFCHRDPLVDISEIAVAWRTGR